jgi:2-hydroxy-6-oxonona-2,4-dienedioate hydrolase
MIESWIELHGRRIRYREAGAGAPIVFAAGLGISADFYEPNMLALARAGFRAIAPDLPGFGRTRGPWRGSSVPALAGHLFDFVRALELRHAGWIGHSLGCQALLQLAAEHPEMVEAMVLAGPTGGYDHRLAYQAAALAHAAVHEPWRLLRAVLRDYVRLSPFNYVGTWVKSAQDDPLRNAQSVRVASLILVGTQDRVPRPEFLSDLSQALRAVTIKLPGGNHGLPLDAQTEFNRHVIEFFKKRGGAEAPPH